MSFLLALTALLAVDTTSPGPDPLTWKDVGFDQRLDEQVPLDLVFRDEDGKQVVLKDLLENKPTILVLAYFRCPQLCTQVLNGLLDSLNRVSFELGEQFNVITVSFDPRETPAMAALKKKMYIEKLGRPSAEKAWHFLTGEKPAIDRLASSVGFRYVYDSKIDQFAHASGIVLLTPRGKVSRYFYGIDFPPRSLNLGLVEASNNKIGSPIHRVLLLCYQYDQLTGKYTLRVMSMLRIAGALTVFVIATFLFVAWKRERKKQGSLAVKVG